MQPPLIPTAMLSEYATDPRRLFEVAYAQYGPVFRFPVGKGESLGLAGPEAVQFLGSRVAIDSLRQDEALSIIPQELGGRYTLLASDGEVHHDLRRLIAPGFSRGAVDNRTGMQLAELARQEIAAAGNAGPTALGDLTTRLAHKLFAALMGIELSDAQSESMDRMMSVLLAVAGKARSRRSLAESEYLRAREEVRTFAEQVVRQGESPLVRRLQAAAGQCPHLISDSEVVTHLLSSFMVVTETVGRACASACEQVAAIADLPAAIHAEAGSLGLDGGVLPSEAVLSNTLTWRCVLEAIRLDPPVWAVTRLATTPFELLGATIEPGDRLVISLSTHNRSAEFFPDPDRYDPDRPEPSGGARAGLYPFGVGVHRCAGASLAQLMCVVVVHSVVSASLTGTAVRLPTATSSSSFR